MKIKPNVKYLNSIILLGSFTLLACLFVTSDSLIILISIICLLLSLVYACFMAVRSLRELKTATAAIYGVFVLYLVCLAPLAVFFLSTGKIVIYNRSGSLATKVELFDAANRTLDDIKPFSLTFVVIKSEREGPLRVRYYLHGVKTEDVIFDYFTSSSQKDIYTIRE